MKESSEMYDARMVRRKRVKAAMEKYERTCVDAHKKFDSEVAQANEEFEKVKTEERKNEGWATTRSTVNVDLLTARFAEDKGEKE